MDGHGYFGDIDSSVSHQQNESSELALRRKARARSCLNPIAISDTESSGALKDAFP